MSDRESTEAEDQAQRGRSDLASKTVVIQSKRYHIDVKENRRGKFIKITEVSPIGKNRLKMSMSAASDFRSHLESFCEYYVKLPPSDPDNLPEDGMLKSEMVMKENRRYYLDLKENDRGRFLRVSQTTIRGPRSHIAIPAQGLVEFKNTLTKLLEDFGTDQETESQHDLPESQHFKIENKTFYFDMGSNYRGIYMRVSEVQPRNQYRTSITIPERGLQRFADIFSDYADKVKDMHDQEHDQQSGDQGGD